MKKIFLFLSILAIFQSVIAQDIPYRSKANPHYWQSRKPHGGYWQQDVHYEIKADVNEKTNIIDATEKLTYHNNSPHTLREIYFHLYQNAFTKGSYLTALHDGNGKSITNMGKYQAAGLGTVIENLKVNGKKVKMSLDNTVLKITLNEPLASGESLEVTMNFMTFFDSKGFRRRMAVYNNWGFPHYNGVHWYPRICVYDIKKGWDLDQHLNKELYGDFGRFDVELTFAENYVVEATGQLMNPKEVFPGDLRERLDIKNFKDKKWGEKPSIVTPYDSTKRKTWKYIGLNVHDFAFTADPAYRLGVESWNGIECIAIVDESHCSGWQKTPKYMTGIIKTFSEDFGMYEYPKIVAADARDGMEYPMLTLDGGRDPDNHGLLVHEIAHNWFYGMIGNNETYRAALDEGFTQFLTSWGLEKLDGKHLPGTPSTNKYLAKHYAPIESRERSVFYRYVNDMLRTTDMPLNTHSNDFGGAIGHENGYGLVYYKTATMLYNLQYVLGDDQFQKAMQHYVKQWKFCHPYFDDFRKSIVEYTHQDLDWFFDQFLESTKSLDYAVNKVQKTKISDKYKIELERKGEMQMPLDVRIISKRGEVYDFYIPNQPYEKQMETTTKTLSKWYGWGVINPTYSFDAKIPGGIKSVEIDPSHRLPDMNPMNNSKNPGRLYSQEGYNVSLDKGIKQFPNRKQYVATWRPDAWWNPVDGIKAGIHVEGSYLNFSKNLDATVWVNTHVPQYNEYRVKDGESFYNRHRLLDYTFTYWTPIRSTDNKISWGVHSRNIDGFAKHRAWAKYSPNWKNQFTISGNALYRYGDFNSDYLLFPNEWSTVKQKDLPQEGPKANTFIETEWAHYFRQKKAFGNYNFTLRVPIPNSAEYTNYNYSYLQFEGKYTQYWKKLDIKTRVFARYGVGDIMPTESALYMQGANPEEMMENKYTRTHGIVPLSMGGYQTDGFSNLHAGGGMNLRGYTGYYAVDENAAGDLFVNYKGQSGASASVEVEFDRFINWKPKKLKNYLHFDTYLFADGGFISRGLFDANNITTLQPTNQWSKFRMDAGAGVAMTIKRFGIFNKAEPLTVRFDVPFFLSSPPFGQEYLDFRWVIGVNRSF